MLLCNKNILHLENGAFKMVHRNKKTHLTK